MTSSDGLESVRSLYLQAVESRQAADAALAEIETLRRSGSFAAGSHGEATLAGYRGAVVTLLAKHAPWPPRKLRHLREGLATLDSVVVSNPEHAEVRYLRLVTCYHLPGIFGRQSTVRDDLASLAQLLPSTTHPYPPEQLLAMARFVLEKGSLTPAQRHRLESLAAEVSDR